jgi:hypothetical protein
MCKPRLLFPEEEFVKELAVEERIKNFNAWLASEEGRREVNDRLEKSQEDTDRWSIGLSNHSPVGWIMPIECAT